jgi:hypothetical protein
MGQNRDKMGQERDGMGQNRAKMGRVPTLPFNKSINNLECQAVLSPQFSLRDTIPLDKLFSTVDG